MVLVSHLNRFIYTKTMKTAGTSVEIYFEDACLPIENNVERGHEIDEIVTSAGIIGHRGGQTGKTWYHHMPAKLIRTQLGVATWDDYYKFCVIRNPFDKVVSYWWFSQQESDREIHRNMAFSEIREIFSPWAIEYAKTLVDREIYTIDGSVSVDYFIRYEDILGGVRDVCEEIHYPFSPDRLGRFKSEYRLRTQHFREYCDSPAAAAVARAFGWELEFFGYGLE